MGINSICPFLFGGKYAKSVVYVVINRIIIN